ncbi:hypothetical protein V7S43_009319 [Phytophthora oleae]|uniref:Uncharacterized protein n=1 Tax=Phytophthora oleae TaxID=2107226 RepID=A0ABD3FJ69_9STRA
MQNDVRRYQGFLHYWGKQHDRQHQCSMEQEAGLVATSAYIHDHTPRVGLGNDDGDDVVMANI